MTRPSQTHQDLDAIFECLTDPRRRYAIRCLQDYEDPMTLADLADEIAVWENDAPITEVPAEEVKQIYLTLYHRHLPKLASAGVVRYDQDQDMVQLAEDAKQLEQFEELLTDA